MSRRSAKYPRRRHERETMRAVGDAGPYGGIDESAPVFEGAPMRAVEDAGPYGVRERGHGRANRGTDPSPYGVCPSGCAGE